MLIRVPEYFTGFTCIADKCTDSCCVGWEIDIDEDTSAKYRLLNAPIGAEIREKTSHGYFPLQKNGRCAFLDDVGLCRIISSVGKEYLCDICREHPRYYGVGAFGIEGGLGLGCEEAARIILGLRKKPRLIVIDRDVRYFDEDEFAEGSEYFRDRLTDLIFETGITKLCGAYMNAARVANDDAYDILTHKIGRIHPDVAPREADTEDLGRLLEASMRLLDECEALNDDWHEIIDMASRVKLSYILSREDELRALIYYFTHRYVREGIEDMSIGGRILFALISALSIIAISAVLGCGGSDVKAAVMYSKNIEYSTDNVDYIIDNLDIL